MSAITPQVPVVQRTFTQLLSSTRRGARLARLLATEQCRTWQVAPTVTERVEQIVAELAANAALHGHVQGRDFRLTLDTTADSLRIAVTDARGDQFPVPAGESGAHSEESGRGLLLVTALATAWGTEPYPPSGKTVWATVGLHGVQQQVGSGQSDVGHQRQRPNALSDGTRSAYAPTTDHVVAPSRTSPIP